VKTEVKPRIDKGFYINDIELVRIKDAQNEQIKKISGGVDANFSYELKYRNGVIANIPSVNDILSEENDGTKSIIRLAMIASSVIDVDTKIAVRFSDMSHSENSDSVSISYDVLSNDKDWTFVTASIIDERIKKVTTSNIIALVLGSKFFRISPVLIPMGVLASYSWKTNDALKSKVERLSEIRSSSKSVIDYLYKVDVMNATVSHSIDYLPLVMILSFVPVLLSLFFTERMINWFPRYTFYWGDATARYDKRVTLIRFLAGGVIFAIIIGMTGNYFYDLIFSR